MARDEGWLAEHMLILKLTSPDGRVAVPGGGVPVARAARPTWPCCSRPCRAGRSRPSATTSPGCASATDGRLYAINPEAGFFGVAPGTGMKTNANAIDAPCAGNCIFTNVALTDDGDVWWEGLTDEPAGAPDRLEGPRLDAGARRSPPPTRTPGSPRRPTSARHRAGLGGPGGRADLGHPVRRPPGDATSRWSPSRSAGSTGCSWAPTSPRRRPPRPRARSASCAATRSRCCRSAATTWPTTSATGWSSARAPDPAKLPQIFYVNWFRKDARGKFLWPGFGENSRVLKWIIQRLSR